MISILFHHYKELKECISEIERIDNRVNKCGRLTVKEEEEEKGKEVDLLRLSSYREHNDDYPHDN